MVTTRRQAAAENGEPARPTNSLKLSLASRRYKAPAANPAAEEAKHAEPPKPPPPLKLTLSLGGASRVQQPLPAPAPEPAPSKEETPAPVQAPKTFTLPKRNGAMAPVAAEGNLVPVAPSAGASRAPVVLVDDEEEAEPVPQPPPKPKQPPQQRVVRKAQYRRPGQEAPVPPAQQGATKTAAAASGEGDSKRGGSPDAPAPVAAAADGDDDSDWEALQSSGDRAPSPAGPAQPAPQLTAEERLRKIELDNLRREADEAKARREEERKQIAAAGVKILSKAERRQRKEEEERLRLVKLQRRRVRVVTAPAETNQDELPAEDAEAPAGLKTHRAEGDAAAAGAGNTQADREARRQARVEALPEPDLALPIRTNLHAMRTGLSFLTSEHRGLRHVQNPQGLPTNATRQEMPPWSRPPTEVFIKNVGAPNGTRGTALETALRLDAMSRRLAEHPYDIPWLEERGHRGIFRRQRAERSIGHIRATLQGLFTSEEPTETHNQPTMAALEANGTVPVPVPAIIARLRAAAKKSVDAAAASTAGSIRPSPSTAPALPASVRAIMARLQGKSGGGAAADTQSAVDDTASYAPDTYAPSKRAASPASSAIRPFAPPAPSVPKAVARLAAAAANSRPAVKVVKLHPPEESAAGDDSMPAPQPKADYAPPLPPASAAKFAAKVKAQQVAVESAMAKAQSLAAQTDATAMGPPDTPSGAGGNAVGRSELPPPPARRGKRVRNPAPLLEP